MLSSNTVILKSFQSETFLTSVKVLRPPKYNNDSKFNFGKKKVAVIQVLIKRHAIKAYGLWRCGFTLFFTFSLDRG